MTTPTDTPEERTYMRLKVANRIARLAAIKTIVQIEKLAAVLDAKDVPTKGRMFWPGGSTK